MKHPAHIERLIDERKELGKKLDKLTTFLNTLPGQELMAKDIAEHNLLCDQRAFMTAYYTVLDVRMTQYEKTLEEAARRLDMTMN